MRYITILLWLLAFNCVSFAGPVVFGVKGGVPLTDLLLPPASYWFDASSGGSTTQRYSTNTNPYTIGPMVEVHLPLGLSIEFDALYKHFNYDHEYVHTGIFNDTTYRYQKVAVSRWEFPLLLKYRPSKRRLSPFISAGPSVNYISGTDQVIESIEEFYYSGSTRVSESRTITTSSAKPVELVRAGTGGITTAIGADFRVRWIRISPEIRYTRWFNPNFNRIYELSHVSEFASTLALRSRQDQIEFMLGVTF